MKKLLFIAFIIPLFAHAQTVQDLDAKNGFLQFHLGDSLSMYKSYIYVPEEKHPDQNEVKVKSIAPAIRKYLDKVVLINTKGIVTEIDVFIRDEASIQHIDDLLTQSYGPGIEIPNPDKDTEGTNLVCTTWTGEGTMLMMMQHNINHTVNGHMTRGRIQALLFKKTGDKRIQAEMPVGFPL